MVQVIEKPDWISWDDIQEVIWIAHEVNRQHGIYMHFPSLSGEEIRKRIEGHGKMFVAVDGEKVVGTAAIVNKKVDLWCGSGNYAYFCFASVLPEYHGQGIYKQLYQFRERESINNGLTRVMFDTHERNIHTADINLKHGYKKVSYKRYHDHFNIVFVKWLKGCPYSDIRCRLEFAKQRLKEKAKTLIRLYLLKHK